MPTSLAGLGLPADLFHQVRDSQPVVHVAFVALVPIRLLAVRNMENRGHMRFNGESSIITTGLQVADDVLQMTITLSRHGIFGFGLADSWVAAVLYVDMNNVVLDIVVETKCILEGMRFGLGAITLEDRVSGCLLYTSPSPRD